LSLWLSYFICDRLDFSNHSVGVRIGVDVVGLGDDMVGGVVGDVRSIGLVARALIVERCAGTLEEAQVGVRLSIFAAHWTVD